MGSGKSGLYSSTSGSSTMPESYPGESFQIGRSIGAAALNYNISDSFSGKYYKFAEGTRIDNVEIFAGKGTGKPLRAKVVEGLTKQYGGKKSGWKHSKGIGIVDCGTRWRKAEVHWFENDGLRVGFKIKEWL
jgi:hypothetical protein